MLKVTDICSTNPADPTYCANPADIKIDRIKADLLFTNEREDLTVVDNSSLKYGTEYPEKVYWFFTKCWDDVRSFATEKSHRTALYSCEERWLLTIVGSGPTRLQHHKKLVHQPTFV